MNVAIIVGALGALTGLLVAAFSWGMARSPAWPERRQFAYVALTAAGYSAFDMAIAADLPAGVTSTLVQIAVAFGALNGVAWLRYLVASESRAPRRVELWLIRVGLAAAALGLLPGVLFTREVELIYVHWAGLTYRTPQPTLIGMVVIVYFCVALGVVAASLRSRRWDGWYGRFPTLAVSVLAVLALNDVLVSAGMLQMPLLFDGASMAAVLVMGLIAEKRFVDDVHRLETTSARLEREVERRTGQLIDAHAALERVERQAGLGRIVAGVAHEINNPLAVVLQNMEDLRRALVLGQGGTPATYRYVDDGLSAAQRIKRIARQMLDAGRASSAGAARLHPFLVAPVIRRVVERSDYETRSRVVTLELDDTLGAVGDVDMSEQVLANLIGNASAALDATGPGGRITIRCERVENRARVTVADDGPGIPDEVRSNLFEPFVTSRRVGAGSGLGLSVSLGLMRSQQGDLYLVNSSSAGTAMAFDLPWFETTAIAMESPVVMTEADRDLIVLVIDDDAGVRETIRRAVGLHFRAEVAATVAEAAARASAEPAIDAVLCDLMMPDGGAAAWLERCRTTHPRLVARTIVITGGPITPKAVALVDACGDRVLYKPFAPDRMRDLVIQVVRAAGEPAPPRGD